MKKKVKQNSDKRKKTLGTESNGVDIVYTNTYSNPMPKLNRLESSDRENEEKAGFFASNHYWNNFRLVFFLVIMSGFGRISSVSWVWCTQHVSDYKGTGLRQGLKTGQSVPKRHDLKSQASPTSFRGQQNLEGASSILQFDMFIQLL